MYLKRLELLGFKSFADRTEFTFPRSVTAIVGPNGCGKSNVVDAFKWIFGEQSAKGLRGEEMKDVIFNGTQTRKPTGFAEVTVVFDNADRALDIDYAEVAVTRRLYRSGESEYLINKQKRRLRDIKELFLDTGLGASSYSMLEQGKIDVLLQASTLDRRIIFEEAAGISRYRVKKAETLRALERTTENLARLGDIIDEVEKRMHRLRVQAGKARRHRECADRLRALRLRLAIQDYRLSVAERAELSCRRHFAGFRLDRLEDLAGRLRAGLDRQRAVREERLEALTGARRRLGDARSRRERTEERIRQDTRRLDELAEEHRRREGDLAALAEVRERIDLDLERERAERERAREEIAGRRALLDRTGAELNERREAVEALLRECEARRAAIVQALEVRSRTGNRLVQVSTELGNLAGRRDRTCALLEAARREGEALDAKGRELEEELSALRAEIQALDGRRAELDGEAAARRARLEAADGRLAGLATVVQDRRSRLDVLRSFEASREGLGGGVQAVLAARDRSPSPEEVRGMVADFVQVERRYAPAVEAALGDLAQSLVIETQEGGLALLGWAREGSTGSVEVITLDLLPWDGGPAGAGPAADRSYLAGAEPCPDAPREGPAALPPEAGVLGFLRDRVGAAPGYEELIDRLLGGVILVEDLRTAAALSRNGLRPCRLVTLDGSRVEPWGAMAIAGPPSAAGIISRRSEMAELAAELGKLAADAEAQRSERDGLAAAIGELEERRRELAEAREALALKLGAAESLLAQAAREREQALREVRVGESELAEIRSAGDELGAERERVETEVAALDARREGDERELQAREAEVGAGRESLRVRGEEVTDLRVRLAEAEEREQGIEKSIAQLEAAREEEERRGQAIETQIGDLVRRRGETERDLESSRSALSGIGDEESALSAEVARAEHEDQEFAEVESGFCAELDRLRAAAEECRKERDGLNLREQEGKLKRNSLVERMAEDYGIDLAALSAALSPDEGAVGAGGRPDTSSEPAPPGAELVAQDPAWDRARAESEIQELRGKLQHLGNVNPEALEELEELEERHRFMATQRDDLRKAEGDLKGIIAEINRTSRELFLKTFEAVQRHFGEIFRKCFGGGMAELVLEEGADVLEAGIEIIARPPGKKLTSLTLMSGGEKTMTTIALLFAIFRSRPSPFCILDEVDAPLDENNIRRFVLILQDFVQSSQFIIITHNKITMAEADSLYGVTMEERGVSKRVAVEFEKYDPDRPETLLAAPAPEGERSSDNP